MKVDRQSPVPPYHQIAETIRHWIATGRIRPGDRLAPIREAASNWGVHMHTVRKAYATLAREELVEMQPQKGTRVLATTGRSSSSLPSWLDSVIESARSRFDLAPDQLVSALRRRVKVEPLVHVLECSQLQAEDHARELMQRFQVRAVGHNLEQLDQVPRDQPLIATYFHYNDIRLRWPDRLHEIRFVAIQPEASIRDRIGAMEEVRVVELSQSKAEHISADVSALYHGRIVAEVWDGKQGFPDEEGVRIFPPRVWAMLSSQQRRHQLHLKLTYVIEADDLERLVAEHRWPLR